MSEKQSFHAFFTFLAAFVAIFVNTMLVSTSEINIIITFLAMLANTALAVSFLFGSLKTSYDKNGITISFFPFMFKKKFIEWKDIKEIGIRDYSPLKEFRGWGVRFSRNGRAYTTQGKTGLQLVLKDNQKILIGTQKPEKIADYLDQLRNEGIINQ